MRSFIISIALLLSLIGTWCFFDTYSSNTLENYGQILESEVLLSIESENWQSASEDFLSLQEEWQEYKQYAVFFWEQASSTRLMKQWQKPTII